MMKLEIKIIEGPWAGKKFSPGPGTAVFGCGDDCDVVLAEDKTMSRRHFEIAAAGREIRLRDLGSLNGTRINNKKCGREPVVLHDGDLVKAGDSLFRIGVNESRRSPTARRTQARGVPAPAKPAGGPAIAGYAVEEKIGSGGFASVYRARRLADSAVVAVKVMSPSFMRTERAGKTVLREIECLRKLYHPNLVALLDSGAAENTVYCVMEYCAGGTLETYAGRRGGRLSAAEAVPLFGQLLRALAYMHVMGYVHRDLKPANILLDGCGEEITAKISDLGLAKRFETAGLSNITGGKFIAGTCSFMPPDQVADFRRVKPAADVWSLGAVFYNALTGRLPHDFPDGADPLGVALSGGVVPLRARLPSAPARLAEFIDRALSPEPALRYRDGGEMLKAFREVLSEH
ncbi:MAG: serine/threonine protein kinase-like protein [Elusimicrobia bacterium]|nr:MAG: serine/threonine protein kinase-like protein [Elusimicrobiota bacterium]KAF0157160.1 MAG: serine/threonine protein kinase-like protein [Elusimicrobiota bacterium]